MEANEAFRISIGKTGLELLVSDHHKKELGLQRAVEQLLKPLKILDRLRFYRHADPVESMDWLVVKVESSCQLALLVQDNQDVLGDAELYRECCAAEEIVRFALAVFRKLVTQSKMSPIQFHNLLRDPNSGSDIGLKMMGLADELGDGVLAMRNPEGRDSIAKSYPIPRMVTLPEIQDGQFLVQMVGRKSALVYRTNGAVEAPKSVGKKIELFWGNVPSSAALADRCFSAMNAGKPIFVPVRETRNRRGMVCRLEWHPDSFPRQS